MRAQTRIFSVATTIACLALTSPGFAQAYGGQGAVQVDLGALNDLPGPGGSSPAPSYPSPNANAPAHYRSSRVSNSMDLSTTIIGGGGDSLAPIEDVEALPAPHITRSYTPARQARPRHQPIEHKHHVAAPKAEKPYHAPAVSHRSSHKHHTAALTPPPYQPTLMTTEELNYMQLQAGKPTLPGGPVFSGASASPRDVAMLPPPHPAAGEIITPDTPLNDSQPPEAGYGAPGPAILPDRTQGTARSTPEPYDTPSTPPPLPPTRIAQVAALPPPRSDDYDQPRRQPAIPSEPPLPPAALPPAATPDDLIDEAPIANVPPNSRIISDPYASQSGGLAPQRQGAAGYGTVGHYDIPSRISLSDDMPVQPLSSYAPAPAEPAPKILKVAPALVQAPSVPAPAVSNDEKINAEPLDAPTPLITNRPPPPAEKDSPALAAKTSTVEATPLDGPDTTQNLNHLEDTKTATPLDMPTAPVTAPSKTPDDTTIEKASVVPATMPTPATSHASHDELAVTFVPGATTLSGDANATVDGLVTRLKQNPDLRIELRSLASATGKDSGSKARRTSLSRALDIKSYLARQGISEDRVDIRALGAPAGQPPTDRIDFFLMR